MARIVLVLASLLLYTQLALAAQVKLQWDINANADPSGTVAIYKSNGCTGSYTIVQTQSESQTTWTDTQVEPGKVYCWYVVGRLAGKESTPSNVLTFQMPQELTLPETSNLRGEIE